MGGRTLKLCGVVSRSDRHREGERTGAARCFADVPAAAAGELADLQHLPEVRSVESAITVLGESTFRRVVSLAVLSELNGDQPAAILHMALVRARFCELAACKFGPDAGEQYLLGMLSLLPAMLGVPMEEIVPILPLRGQIARLWREP